MKEKLGTILDREIIRRAKVRAAQEGKPLRRIIEEALRAYLSCTGTEDPEGLVDKTWATFRVSKAQLREAFDAEVLEA